MLVGGEVELCVKDVTLQNQGDMVIRRKVLA